MIIQLIVRLTLILHQNGHLLEMMTNLDTHKFNILQLQRHPNPKQNNLMIMIVRAANSKAGKLSM